MSHKHSLSGFQSNYPAAPRFPFPELANRFKFTADLEEVANALEFLTTPAHQSSTTKKPKKWQAARHTLLTFVAYVFMVSEHASLTFQKWPSHRRANDREVQEAHQSVLRTYFGPQGEFQSFPPTTFACDTIVYFRKVYQLFQANEPLQNLHQVSILSIVGGTVIQFITDALDIGVEAEEAFGTLIDREAFLMIRPYLPLPDRHELPASKSRQLTASSLCIGDRVQYRDSNRRENTFEILEITESARRGFTFKVGPPGQEESNNEYEISGEMMEDYLRNAKLV